MKRCGRLYGKKLVCRRAAGHRGHHAQRLSLNELKFSIGLWRAS